MPVHPLGDPITARTIGELIDLADSVPRDEVLPAIRSISDKINVLYDQIQDDPGELPRRMVLLGVLVNRAIFEVFDLPKDRDFQIL